MALPAAASNPAAAAMPQLPPKGQPPSQVAIRVILPAGYPNVPPVVTTSAEKLVQLPNAPVTSGTSPCYDVVPLPAWLAEYHGTDDVNALLNVLSKCVALVAAWWGLIDPPALADIAPVLKIPADIDVSELLDVPALCFGLEYAEKLQRESETMMTTLSDALKANLQMEGPLALLQTEVQALQSRALQLQAQHQAARAEVMPIVGLLSKDGIAAAVAKRLQQLDDESNELAESYLAGRGYQPPPPVAAAVVTPPPSTASPATGADVDSFFGIASTTASSTGVAKGSAGVLSGSSDHQPTLAPPASMASVPPDEMQAAYFKKRVAYHRAAIKSRVASASNGGGAAS